MTLQNVTGSWFRLKIHWSKGKNWNKWFDIYIYIYIFENRYFNGLICGGLINDISHCYFRFVINLIRALINNLTLDIIVHLSEQLMFILYNCSIWLKLVYWGDTILLLYPQIYFEHFCSLTSDISISKYFTCRVCFVRQFVFANRR